jgi:hypothetical protein
MTLEEILASPESFENGKHQVLPRYLRLRRDLPIDYAEAAEFVQNRKLISYAVFELGQNSPRSGTDFNIMISRLARLQGRAWALDARQFMLARQFGIINTLPSVSEDDMNDQSKVDVLVKGLAILQVIYVVTQLIVRHYYNRPFSQLELTVVAFAVCAFFTYCFQWSKPQDIKIPRFIDASRFASTAEILKIADIAPAPIWGYYMNTRPYTVPNFALYYCGNWKPYLVFMFGSCLSGVVFGLLHCIAWNFNFPSSLERSLWRYACIITIVIPVGALLFPLTLFVGERIIYAKEAKGKANSIAMLTKLKDGILLTVIVLNGVVISLFGCARLYMIFEVFRSLFYLPPDAFRTSWASSLPYITQF